VAIFAFVTVAFAQGPSTVPSKKTVQDAQVELKALGYDPGPADGGMGAKTVAAVKKFQSDHDIPVSGMLDRKTMNVLTATPASTATQKSRADAIAAEAAALSRVVSNVAALDEYKSLNVIDLVSAFDANKDIDALAPLERQAVLDVSLERLYVTRKPQVSLPGVPISQAPGGYLHEGTGGLSMTGSTRGRLRNGTAYELVAKGTFVDGDHHVFQVGTGQTTMFGSWASNTLRGVKGSATIISVDKGIWLVSTKLPRDRIAMGPMGLGGGEVALPTGDGSIYGFSGEIEGFLPGVTIKTNEGKTVYFALIADLGLAYLAGNATVLSGDPKIGNLMLPVK
jgi:hypothetical protein